MSFRTKLYTSVIAGAFILAGAGQALAIETTARNVILTDYDTGQILFAKDHQKMVPPASMSKLMTVSRSLRTVRFRWTIPLPSVKTPGAKAEPPAAVQRCF